MSQIEIPCLWMRGGTSKGPFLDLADLPTDRDARDRVLLRIMGSPDARQIDGLGGANFLTSKLAMVGRSERPGVDVDYLFAQVAVDAPIVDTEPPCGNMLTGVGPFAIEMGWVPASQPETRVVIYNVNTQSNIEAVVQTPGGRVEYEGTTAIDGVPGTAAPITLNFLDVGGGKTGALLPTGIPRESINNIEVSCIDASMPMIIVHAESFGLIGNENQDFFAAQTELMAHIESIRRIAGERMGLGDVRNTVVPKVGLVSRAVDGGTIRSRYLTPHTLHDAHAVTGGICVAAAACLPGSVANDLAAVKDATLQHVVIEHPSGTLEIRLELTTADAKWGIAKAGVIRTARKITRGFVFVDESDWAT